ncbi:PE family protein [Mycobacterium haemophilum]|uniref:PE family protein n=1 Tax=Mycobacterium haemophilum TaxID=29311 RepID=A0A0I9USW6_9MYCO|nr:PE family protein [Mycobacterium haemophilum]AKN16115.1 PE family protein [Mycobacterium haemophilum DSM 44634]KLO29864.1 PE family protein [Mycobacterium haemophilum]KLO38446.1 PE family protein [Mycobacterium haemophilum]KLO44780.1 PE family protein [Mycobacterium haemophilum]KLO56123.1 PE family protein [Mycobacterium haemophilum]
MSFVTTNPEALKAAAEGVREIKDRAVAISVQAAPVTNAVKPPAIDAVSTRAATYLVDHAKKYKDTIAEAATVLEAFAVALTTGAEKYATTEANTGKDFT